MRFLLLIVIMFLLWSPIESIGCMGSAAKREKRELEKTARAEKAKKEAEKKATMHALECGVSDPSKLTEMPNCSKVAENKKFEQINTSKSCSCLILLVPLFGGAIIVFLLNLWFCQFSPF